MTEFQPPPGRDRPKEGTASGGSRPSNPACFPHTGKNQDLLTAVVPGHHLGLTMMERPEFIVYLPLTTAQSAELSIFDKQMQGVYQMTVPVNKGEGFVSVNLPEDAPALVTDKSYYWTFALICNQSDRTEDVVVGGWIERSPLNHQLRSHLANASSVQKVSLFAQHGYWYDAVSEILQMRRKQSDSLNLVRTWENLLQSVGLNHIAKKPINDSQLVTTRKYRDI